MSKFPSGSVLSLIRAIYDALVPGQEFARLEHCTGYITGIGSMCQCNGRYNRVGRVGRLDSVRSHGARMRLSSACKAYNLRFVPGVFWLDLAEALMVRNLGMFECFPVG